MGDNTVNYVDFGGVMVPENSRRVTVADKKHNVLYCVFLDNKGSKVTYPKHDVTAKPTQKQYVKLSADYNPFTHNWKQHETYISKKEFDKVWNDSRDPNTVSQYSVKSYYTGSGEQQCRHIEQKGGSFYDEFPVDTQPKIEYENQEGIFFDTKKLKISNLKDAEIKGSSDEDEITLENTKNCTVDTSEDNNNIFFSDKVKVINGYGNKVISGDNDKTTFETYNYTENITNIKAKHNKEGIHKQP